MKKGNIIVPIAIVIVMVAVGTYILLSNRITGEYIPSYDLDDFYAEPQKVKTNEYQIVDVSEKDMANNYFNDFTMMLFEDIDRAYSKLDDGEKRYSNVYDFKEFASKLTNDFTELPIIDKYRVDVVEGKTTYKISDKNGNYYTFHVEGVMKYTISFD